MTVKELIDKLATYSQDAKVRIAVGNNDGCDTCGYGESKSEVDVEAIHDLETYIVLDQE